jgi:haloalkane dehalogenase
MPDPTDRHPRRRIPVLDAEMSYVSAGEGNPIVFLHGNPMWSYLWRNIIPYVSERGRCLAPDLVGMGASGPSPSRAYRFLDHARYLDAWFDALELTADVTLVLHDWGSALGFYWARRHPERIRAIAYMEAIVQPRQWADVPEARAALFRDLRSERGEKMIFDDNAFIEVLLPKLVLRPMSVAEMDAYRRPFLNRELRLRMLVWPRELPIEGEPADVVAIVEDYGRWMATNSLPKLFVAAEPGSLVIGRAREFCRSWPNQEEIAVPGIHFLQEDSPDEIGRALAAFVRRT